ncbi:MAG TPA: DUF6084 family protein [Candidatus Dormibacteraeota bacterium]
MPDLDFSVDRAEIVEPAMTPTLAFRLAIVERLHEAVDAVALQCQIQIEVARRPYTPRESEALLDLFGPPARYGRTLKTMLWTRVTTMVPGFEGQTSVELQVPCTFDLSVAAGRYFFALDNGSVPLTFQFSGTVFYRDEGALSVSPISWTKETRFPLPVATWRQLMDTHYHDSAWLCLRRDLIDRIARHKANLGLPTFDDAVAAMLPPLPEAAPS